jgi:hypothetical protein
MQFIIVPNMSIHIYTVFIVQAYEMSMELLSTWCCMAAFFSASGVVLSQEVADSKINVQSACALDTRYFFTMVLNRTVTELCQNIHRT